MTDSTRRKFKQVRTDQSDQYQARRIRTKVHDARNSISDAGVRWPFELLQNALDAGPRPGESLVNLSLSASKSLVTFEHDGAPFSLEELVALLSGGSSKDFESDEKTGRFGTGFLVTHVLAETTRLHGLISVNGTFEEFWLTLDRGGDEESIRSNIRRCEEDLEAAVEVSDTKSLPSARFEYRVENSKTLELGLHAILSSLPYLFATRPTLGKVEIRLHDEELQVWTPGESISVSQQGATAVNRSVLVESENGDKIHEYRTVRFCHPECERAGVIVVLESCGEKWQCCIPDSDFPRLFRDYPIRTSSFIPTNFVLDGKFDVSQERDRLSMCVDDKELLIGCLNATDSALSMAIEEDWGGLHDLARLARCEHSFAKSEEEQEWWNGQLGTVAQRFAELPIVETRCGKGRAVELDEWWADFPLPRLLESGISDEIALERVWPLVNDGSDLYPPVEELSAAWAETAEGWADLGVPVNRVSLQNLADYVRPESGHLADLAVRIDSHVWLSRFVDVVGECWQTRGGTEASVFENLLPNQNSSLRSPEALRRDEGLSEELKDISAILGIDIREQLLDRRLFEAEGAEHLIFLNETIRRAIPSELTEQHVLSELVTHLDETLSDGDRVEENSGQLLQGVIRLYDYLWRTKGIGAASIAKKLPLLSCDHKIVRWTNGRMLMAPISNWHADAQEFAEAYPPSRVLTPHYTGDVSQSIPSVVNHLVEWGIAVGDPISEERAAELKEKGLSVLARVPELSEGVTVTGETFPQIALLRSAIFNRVERNEIAARALLGMVVRYVATHDPQWREFRTTIGKKSGESCPLEIRNSLWVSDLRSRAWVPHTNENDEDEKTIVPADSITLLPLLDPQWLEGNEAGINLLAECFGFDALDVRLLGAAPDESDRLQLRNGLARLVEAGGADPSIYDVLRDDLLQKSRRERDVQRSQRIGYAIQAAIESALKKQNLHVEVIDWGFDLAIGDEAPESLEERAVWLEVGAELLEIKATTTGHPRMTPKQAETAAQQHDRYSLCVVDLRDVSEERLDSEWAAEDVEPLAHMVTDIGEKVKGTFGLVEKARVRSVSIRNEGALRYEVPPELWLDGVSISDWIEIAFGNSDIVCRPD